MLYPLGVHPHAVVTTRLSKPSVLSTNVTVRSFSDNINHAFELPFGWEVGALFGVFQVFHCGSGSSLRWDMGRYFLGSRLILCKNFWRVLRAGIHLQQGLKWRHLRVIDLPELAKDPEASFAVPLLSLLSVQGLGQPGTGWEVGKGGRKRDPDRGAGEHLSAGEPGQPACPGAAPLLPAAFLDGPRCGICHTTAGVGFVTPLLPAAFLDCPSLMLVWDLSHPTQKHPSL